MDDIYYRLLRKDKSKKVSLSDNFQKISPEEIKTKDNELFSQIYTSTLEISSFFEDSIKRFPSLFENNLKSLDECITYLEKRSKPNKCICAGIIDEIPGWRCVDCSKYENSIYCHDCFVNIKDYHKNHKVLYLNDSGGMCDCGDPDTLYKFCTEHSGPFVDQKQIDEYITQNFEDKIINNLKEFFDEFFNKFSKYFILTSKCDLFMDDIFQEKFNDDESDDEEDDVQLLKSNFCIIFQNFIFFLRIITKNNLAMFHIIATYFLKSNFDLNSEKMEDKYMTEHTCIEINKQDLKFLFCDKTKNEKNICKCPFLRLFLENYRNDVHLISAEEEKEFLFSFNHNLSLRAAFCIIYFFLYEKNIYNLNSNMIESRNQFYLEDALELIAKKTSFLEDSVDILIKYIIIKLISEDTSKLRYNIVIKMYNIIRSFVNDNEYFSKPKIKILMPEKTLYYKKIIDLICLFHNIYKYKSIVPHPQFQEQQFHSYLFYIETNLDSLITLLNYFLDYNKIDKLKEIYQYIIYKILNQKKEGIKQLENNEYTIHLVLYRAFGTFINGFCFNNSFINNCTLLESINYFKTNFFESQKQIEDLVDIILNDYFKFFGFISGCQNNFFKYYDRLEDYFSYYTTLEFYPYDFNILKYIFVLTDRKIDINSYFKISSIEEEYTLFNKAFNNDINNNNLNNKNSLKKKKKKEISLIDNNKSDKKEKRTDEINYIMQWKMLFELLIYTLKDDTCCYWNLINNYKNIISTKTKGELFNNIKNNKYAIDDLKNLLQKKLILNIISQGNLIDKQNLDKKIDEYLLTLFEENNLYDNILEEITYNKKNGETKMFYLKDKYLKYFDCNYYFDGKEKSEAQKYILNFKKDVIKIYNSHFYNHSKLTFDFFETVYEKVLLNKDNLELIIRMIKQLINDNRIIESLDQKSVRNSLLPIILNYLIIFSFINTKSFIEFKMENKEIINNIYELLFNYIKNNDTNKNNLIDKELEDHIKEVLNQLNRYQIIYDYFQGDLTKLNKYDYNTTILEQLRQNQNLTINNINIIPENSNPTNEKKQKVKNIRDKLKFAMKKKSNILIKKIESNEEIIKAIDEEIRDSENINNNNDETMCFYCRNSIKLNSYEVHYGKLGLIIKDLFYVNSIKSTLREGLLKFGLNEDNIPLNFSHKYNRIISCGHYFHDSCFIKGKLINENNEFNCPLCLKKQNILIPPLTLFHDKYSFFKSEKFDILFNEEEKQQNKIINDNEKEKDISLFKSSIEDFLEKTEIINIKKSFVNYNLFLENMYPQYKSYLNYLENIFYLEATSFHKYQQIDNFKNIILSIRLFLKDYKKDISKYIKQTIFDLINISEQNQFNFRDSYMHYPNLFEKLTLSLIILFDYEEFKDTFKYILYLFLPYFISGLYLKKLLLENQKNKLNVVDLLNKKMNISEFNKFLDDNNKYVMNNLNYFIKKFCLIKLISDYNNKNENIINNFNELSCKKILEFIDMNDLINILPKNNELSLNDIKINLLQIFNSEEKSYKLIIPNFKYDKTLKTIFDKIKNKNEESIQINKELVIQFSPIKFDFIRLNGDIFDFIIDITKKKCCECSKTSKVSYICLICGEKICYDEYGYYEINGHTRKCTGNYCIYICTKDMISYYFSLDERKIKLMNIYVNKAGTGPKEGEIENEFYLSQEKMKLLIKNYICKDINLLN